MAKPKFQPRPDAEFRQGQLLTGYGPGALIDLPDDAVVMGGLEFWGPPEQLDPVEEERLAEFLRREGQRKPLLRKPPSKDPHGGQGRRGVKAFPFPYWMLAQVTRTYEVNGRIYRTRPLVNRGDLTGGFWLDENRKKVGVVPVRFVRACEHGHLDDVDWYGFVGAKRSVRLWLDEGGAGNDFSEIFVRAEDESVPRRPLADINLPEKKPLGFCNGFRPWLGHGTSPDGRWRPWDIDPAGCRMPFRLLTRSATNAYFSQTVSVISIPDGNAEVRRRVDQVYADFLSSADSADEIAFFRKKQAKVKVALGELPDEVVWQEVERRREKRPREQKPLKQSEIETFLAQPVGEGTGGPEDAFFARRSPVQKLSPVLAGKIDRVVLVHRLREVVAQVGFTRFDAETVDIDHALSLDTQPAPLAREANWYPAVENRGEGIFIGFSPAAISAWRDREALKERAKRFQAGLVQARRERGLSGPVDVNLPYVMLHSLSHLLLTTVSLDCGYATSAIRERVYASEAGYGILLYTGAPGVEGTLGGLIEVGRRIDRYLERALELAELCSSDPVCSDHKPDDPAEKRWLHGAACHGCLLIAETSCERRNELLDRALVVPTLMERDLAFFDGGS